MLLVKCLAQSHSRTTLDLSLYANRISKAFKSYNDADITSADGQKWSRLVDKRQDKLDEANDRRVSLGFVS